MINVRIFILCLLSFFISTPLIAEIDFFPNQYFTDNRGATSNVAQPMLLIGEQRNAVATKSNSKRRSLERSLMKEFSFEMGTHTWMGDFADYPEKQENFYELAWGWENLPASNDSGFKKGIYLAGNNHSDDLFMYVKTPITNLKKNTLYSVTINVDLASDVPVGTFGAGGAQGESVYIKIGASQKEPKKMLINGYYVLDVDKGNQQESGKNAVVVGNLANPLVNPDSPRFAILQVDNYSKPLLVKTDEQGQLWIFIGTDSGYEGITKYYIGKITIHLQE